MKKVYSIILLFAYLVGTMQPILPMIEYQLHSGNIIEYLYANGKDSADDAGKIFLRSNHNSQDDSGNKSHNLLKDSFYPVAIAIHTEYQRFPLKSVKNLHTLVNLDRPDPTRLPNPPPPQFG